MMGSYPSTLGHALTLPILFVVFRRLQPATLDCIQRNRLELGLFERTLDCIQHIFEFGK